MWFALREGGDRAGWCFTEPVSFRALQEDGVKVLIVWLLAEAKGADMDDEFGEGWRQAFTQFFCCDRLLHPEDVILTNVIDGPR